MAGLYIHIPFCRSKCAYCDFFSLPIGSILKNRPTVMEEYCRALLTEFQLRKSEINEPITTIYIGGGTPTTLQTELLTQLISSLKLEVIKFNSRFSSYKTKSIREFTIEANPEDISFEAITRLKKAGITRISIGIQSFDNCQLNSIMRQHGPSASLKSLSILNSSGINYSADLIYGLPEQSIESWETQLTTLLDFNPPHFSAYLLSYEPGTLLYARKENGKVTEADEDTANKMYEILIKTASSRGYNHYEISNFAQPGYEAKHNSSYWNLTPYIGLGCSAHSFDGDKRRVNPANIRNYIEHLLNVTPSSYTSEDEETIINKVNDYIITSLRTIDGISLSRIEERWGSQIKSLVIKNIQKIYREGRLEIQNDNYRIPEHLWLTSDAILRELILDA